FHLPHINSSTHVYSLYLDSFFFLYTTPTTTVIYTLSLHDALPIYNGCEAGIGHAYHQGPRMAARFGEEGIFSSLYITTMAGLCKDRKSTRLNSSHGSISYAVFCLKKKKKKNN